MTRLLAVLFLLFANSAFAQVTAPDYQDPAQWEYFECDGNFFQPQDENYYLLHQDYKPLGQKGDFPVVIVAYRPVRFESVKDYSSANAAIDALEPGPWFLMYVRNNDPVGITADLYEFVNGKWVEFKFKSPLYVDELDEYLKQKYNLM